MAEQMPKALIAAISGSAMGRAFKFALNCDVLIAQQGKFQIGLPEVNVGAQRLPRIVGTAPRFDPKAPLPWKQFGV